ncbi:hypothetical protein RJ641_024798 [Dillenia turbinata]|uniref:Uncharacterized protein n=1 Tax=Dillenia turbinata TaxID=194707 RepID=A0AAN8ZMV8_9MAGN
MPSVPVEELMLRPLIPSVNFLHGGSTSHRLKHRLEKGDRRVTIKLCAIQFLDGNLMCLGYFCSFWLLQMDICSPHADSVTKDVNSFRGLKPSAWSPIRNGLLNELGNSFTKLKVDIEDGQDSSPKSSPSSEDGYYTFEEGSDRLEEQSRSDVASPKKKHLNKCATFPSPGDLRPSGALSNEDVAQDLNQEEADTAESGNPAFSRSTSLPTPSKLVSAIKGSREKEGLPAKKMSVSWAPDVYEPQPSDFSHVGKIKSQRPYKNIKENKKNGKGKQKGKAAKGAGAKDKKQLRRLAGKAKVSLESTEHSASLFYRDYSMPPEEILDSSDLCSPDSCGNGFLKTSFSKVQTPVAEAYM